MATFTVSIPADLKAQMDAYPEINLSQYLKKQFQRKLTELKSFDERKKKGAP